MSLIVFFLGLMVIIQILILRMLNRVQKELKTGNQILELSVHLKKATDNLQAAIEAQSQPKQKGKSNGKPNP